MRGRRPDLWTLVEDLRGGGTQHVPEAVGVRLAFRQGPGAVVRALGGGPLAELIQGDCAQQQTACRIGTERALKILEAREPEGLEGLHALHEVMAATSICGLGQAALIPVTSILERST